MGGEDSYRGTTLASKDEHSFLQYNNAEVVRWHANSALIKSKSRKMMTRFLAHDDPSVLYALVRDLDSRFSPRRELVAVNEWLGSDDIVTLNTGRKSREECLG